MKFRLFFALLFVHLGSYAQLIGGEAFLNGHFLKAGVAANGNLGTEA